MAKSKIKPISSVIYYQLRYSDFDLAKDIEKYLDEKLPSIFRNKLGSFLGNTLIFRLLASEKLWREVLSIELKRIAEKHERDLHVRYCNREDSLLEVEVRYIQP